MYKKIKINIMALVRANGKDEHHTARIIETVGKGSSGNIIANIFTADGRLINTRHLTQPEIVIYKKALEDDCAEVDMFPPTQVKFGEGWRQTIPSLVNSMSIAISSDGGGTLFNGKRSQKGSIPYNHNR